MLPGQKTSINLVPGLETEKVENHWPRIDIDSKKNINEYEIRWEKRNEVWNVADVVVKANTKIGDEKIKKWEKMKIGIHSSLYGMIWFGKKRKDENRNKNETS